MCFYLMLEIKSCFFKKWVLLFLDKGTFQGGSQVLQNFEAQLFIKGVSDRFRILFREG